MNHLRKEVIIMTGDRELFYWESNPEWYRTDPDGKIEMTEKAPERAKKSFEMCGRPCSAKKNPFVGKTIIDVD